MLFRAKDEPQSKYSLNIQNKNTANQQMQTKQEENHRYFCCYAAFCRKKKKSLTLVETETNKQKTTDTTLTAFPALMKNKQTNKNMRNQIKICPRQMEAESTSLWRNNPNKQSVPFKNKITKITKQFLEKKPFLEEAIQ